MTVNTIADEFWSWTPPNGAAVSLQQPWLGIGTIGGSRFAMPQLRGSDYEIPFRNGMQYRPKYANARTITLVMWTAGVDQDTNQPADDQRLAWNDNWLGIRQMFWNMGNAGSQQGTLTRNWFITQGGQAQVITGNAQAELAGTMDPTMTGRTRSDFSVDLLLTDPYFYGNPQSEDVPYNDPFSVVNLGDSPVGAGYGEGFLITLTGPLTNPTLTNQDAGIAFTVAATIGSGVTLVLDVLNFTAIDSNGINYLGVISHTGAREWMLLAPTNDTDNTMILTSTNGADTGMATLQWSPPYL